MATTYTADTDKTPTTGSSFTYTSFAVSGSNPVILVLIALDSTTATVSSVAVSAGLSAGTPIELITKRDATSSLRTYCSIWVIPAPSGTGTITVTLSASVPWQSNAILFAGADQTTPCPTGAGNVEGINGTANPLTSTLTNLTANDAAVIIGANANNGDAPSITTGTSTFNDNTTNVNAAAGYRIGSGALACTWGTGLSQVICTARIVAASGGGGVKLRRNSSLNGLGASGPFFHDPMAGI